MHGILLSFLLAIQNVLFTLFFIAELCFELSFTWKEKQSKMFLGIFLWVCMKKSTPLSFLYGRKTQGFSFDICVRVLFEAIIGNIFCAGPKLAMAFSEEVRPRCFDLVRNLNLLIFPWRATVPTHPLGNPPSNITRPRMSLSRIRSIGYIFLRRPIKLAECWQARNWMPFLWKISYHRSNM